MYLSIDPGVNNCGLVVFDVVKDVFTVKETKLIKNIRKFTDEEKILEKAYGNRTVKVMSIIDNIKDFIAKYDIKEIAIEAPFYNSLTPMAYGSLLEVIFSIKYLIVMPNNLKMTLIEPLLVKKLFSNKSLATKDLIKEFLITKREDKTIVLDKDPLELSDHETDAIAVGFVYYLTSIKERENANCSS